MPGAAANRAGKRFADLVLAGLDRRVQQGFGRHDQAGDAKSALDCTILQERLLHRVQLTALLQALDRCDRTTVPFNRQRNTAQHGLATFTIDRANTTTAGCAAAFRTGQPDFIAQHVEQGFIWRYRQFVLVAVDGQCDQFLAQVRVPVSEQLLCSEFLQRLADHGPDQASFIT